MTCKPSQGPACRYLCRFPFLVRDRTTGHCERDQRRYGEQRLPFSTFKKVVVRHSPRALAIVAEVPDLTREQYEMVVKKVNESGSPVGALFHAGGPIEGGYRIVEVWETRGKRRRLLRLRAVQRSRRGEPNRTEDHHDLAGVRPG